MNIDWTTIALIIQSIAIIIALLISIYTMKNQIQSTEVQTFLQLIKSYDEIAKLRANNPDVLILGHNWRPEFLEKIYSNPKEAKNYT